MLDATAQLLKGTSRGHSLSSSFQKKTEKPKNYAQSGDTKAQKVQVARASSIGKSNSIEPQRGQGANLSLRHQSIPWAWESPSLQSGITSLHFQMGCLQCCFTNVQVTHDSSALNFFPSGQGNLTQMLPFFLWPNIFMKKFYPVP